MCPIVSELCSRHMSIEDVFRNQLCSRIEIKLKEFNFKVIYNILPCNVNLVNWRIKDSDKCDICASEHTIEHLLFNCKRSAYLWKVVKDVYHIDVTFGTIVCGLNKINSNLSHTITLLSFLLYKEWLIHSLENTQRCLGFPFHLYIGELQLRDNIYKWNGLDIDLIPIIQYLKEKYGEYL